MLSKAVVVSIRGEIVCPRVLPREVVVAAPAVAMSSSRARVRHRARKEPNTLKTKHLTRLDAFYPTSLNYTSHTTSAAFQTLRSGGAPGLDMRKVSNEAVAGSRRGGGLRR